MVRQGWIPFQILVFKDNHVIAKEYYNAFEHNLFKGEIILSLKELNGWIWGEKEKEPNKLGWAPLSHLKKM